MSDSSQQPILPEELESYLDGQMSPADAKAFEHKLRGNRAMEKEITIQRAIDQSLHRSFSPPSPPKALLELLKDPSSKDSLLPEKTTILRDQKPTKRSVRTVLMVLAAVVAWVIVGWRYLDVMDQADGYRELALAEIYENRIESGFKPKWVCEDDREFAKTFFDRNGQAILLQAIPEGTEMVGLAYLAGVGPKTTTLMARVDGHPVMVFVDRAEEDASPDKPGWLSGLTLFREQRDGLVFYELTPLDRPRVIEWLQPVELSEVP